MASNNELNTLLDRLNEGWTIEQLESELREQPAEIQQQVRLASALKQVELPVMSLASRQAQQRQILAAAATELASQQRWWERLWGTIGQGQSRPILLAGLTLAALLIVLAGVVLTTILGPADGSVTVASTIGTVEVADIDATTWNALNPSDKVEVGKQVRTAADGEAVLLFADGSSIVLEANSTVAVNALDLQDDRIAVVRLTQINGVSRHNVMATGAENDHYFVSTPAGQINVKGTTFTVAVASSGTTRLVVDSGAVEMTANDKTVPVLLGQATLATVADGPLPASTAFEGNGQISQMAADRWTIGGLEAVVPEEAIGRADVTLGEIVAVSGRLLQNGLWQVDQLKPASIPTNEFYLLAPLVNVGQGEITVGPNTLPIAASSIIQGESTAGDYVKVTLKAAGGQAAATSITPVNTSQSLLVTITPSPEATATSEATITIEATAPSAATAINTPTPQPTPDSNGKIYLCHLPPGNPDNFRTIYVDYAALQGHLNHGDTIGPCAGILPTSTPSVSPTSTETGTPAAGPSATPTPEGMVTLCHIPGGNPDNAQTLTVAASAVQAHLNHGDYLGICIEATSTNIAPSATPVAPTATAVAPTATALPPTATVVPTNTPESGGLVTLCHIPPGNPDNPVTIMVPPEDVQEHLDHGDYLGPCN